MSSIRKINCPMEVYLYGKEKKEVYIKELQQVDNIEEYSLGSIVGFVTIDYPVAGLDLHLELKLYKHEPIFDEFFDDYYDVTFKIPFCIKNTHMNDIEYALWEQRIHEASYLDSITELSDDEVTAYCMTNYL